MKRYRVSVWFWSVVCLAGSCLCVVLFSGRDPAVAAQEQLGRDPSRALSTNVDDGFTVAAAGDVTPSHPATPYPENKPVAGILRAADVTVGNYEGSIVDYRQYKVPAAIVGSYTVMDAEPGVAEDLRKMGFKMLGRANNHEGDWGAAGARETDRWLDKAGIVHAGDGETRALAREARFYDTARGRVGLISITSTISDAEEIAENPNGIVPGRWGVNPLRIIRFAGVTARQMQILREIRRAYHAYPDTTPDDVSGVIAGPAYKFPHQPGPDELYLLGLWYKVADKTGFSYVMDPLDEREILQSIRDAKTNCDFLIVMIHAHEVPADFVTKIAHEAVDAGADEFVGTGPHHMLGIEIYKKRPIFYSLGDLFYARPLTAEPVPQEELEASSDPAPADGVGFETDRWSHTSPDNPTYVSAIVVSRFEKNQLSEVRIYPIDLGWARRAADRGTPRMASSEVSQRFLKKQQKQSAAYGTAIQIMGNVGVIHIAQ